MIASVVGGWNYWAMSRWQEVLGNKCVGYLRTVKKCDQQTIRTYESKQI